MHRNFHPAALDEDSLAAVHRFDGDDGTVWAEPLDVQVSIPVDAPEQPTVPVEPFASVQFDGLTLRNADAHEQQ